MNWNQDRLAFIAAALLVVATALYALGTTIEHSQRTEHHAAQSHVERHLASTSADTGRTPAEKKSETSTSPEVSTESSHEVTTTETATVETTAETTTGQTTPESTTSSSGTGRETGGERHSEKIAGIDPESWLLVGIAIAISLLVAAGVYWRRGRWFVAAIVMGVVFAAADIRELVHQLQESRTTVATIAGILIGLHLLAALAAAAGMRATGERASTV